MNSGPDLKVYANYFKGDCVAIFPTDTVIGLGCRFDSVEGIAKIRKIKCIVDRNPLAVLISNESQLDLLKVRRSRLANQLMKEFWPGPLTLVLTAEVAFPCSGEANTLGLRMPDADLLREFTTLLPGHGAPMTSDFILDQVKCIKGILDKSLEAKPYQSFAGNSMISTFGKASVAFNPANL